MRQDLVGQIPSFKKHFLRYESYASKPFDEVFTSDLLSGAETHEINTLESAVFMQRKPGKYSRQAFHIRRSFQP